jgi:hypothetical protein
MDTIKIITLFWRKVVVRSFRFAVSFEEVRGETVNIVRGLIINLLALIGIGNFSSQPVEFVPVLYWLGLLLTGRLLIGLIYFPAKIYSEIRSEAVRFTFQDVEIKEYKFPRESGYGVGLSLISNKPKNHFILLLDAKIQNIKHKGKELLENREKRDGNISILIGSGYHFEKGSGGVLNKSAKNSLAKVSVVPLTKFNNDKAYILIGDGDDEIIEMEDGSTYRIILNFSAKLFIGGQRDLEGVGIWCDLVYSKNWLQQKVVSLKIIERTPPYAD